MLAPRYRVYFWAGPLILVSWLTLACLDPDPPGPDTPALGYFFGSLFAHSTLAAAWTAFGPAPLVWRLPLSLVWAGSLPVAVSINIGLHGGPSDGPFNVGACLLGQWLALQFPLWGLVLGFGLQLRHNDEIEPGDSRRLQFGIRQLIIVTAIIGVVLGIGRIVLPHLPRRGEVAIFIFLAVAAIVLTLPLLLAALMRRMAIPGVLLVLLLIGVATAWEFTLFESIGGSGPDTEDFIAINVSSAAVVLIIAVAVRLNGYALYTRALTQH